MRVALTGGIGSGKSAVAGLLADRGAVVIDADAIAREVVAPGQPALREIVQRFGTQMLHPDGTLDRGRLAGVVFSDPGDLADLKAITHPRIAARSAELLDAAPRDSVVVYDMPLLVEQGAVDGWDAIIVVDAPEDIRLERLVARGMDRADALRRMAAQATRAERLAAADHVVDNGGDVASLSRQVDSLWAALSDRSA